MKQKILIGGLSLLLTVSLVGCGGQQAQQEPQEPDQEKVQQTEPASTTPPVESMEVKNENNTAIPLTELEDIEPEEADGAGTVEGAGSVESDLEEVQLFTEVNETVYATGTVNIRASYMADSDKLGSLAVGDSVTRTGIAIEGTEAEGWSRVTLSNGTTAYISNSYLSTTKPVQQSTQGTTQDKPSGQTQQQQPTQQQPSSQPSGGGQPSTDTSMEEWAARRQQMAIEQGYIGTDPSERMDINDPNYADWVSGLVGELNGN